MEEAAYRQNGALYSLKEDIANAVTHAIGAVAAIIGTAILLAISIRQIDSFKIASAVIYGFGLITLFTMSSLYHAITNQSVKKVFQKFDHTSISLLIAGSYTPYTLVLLRGSVMGWIIFGLVWGLCIMNIVLKSISISRFDKISMACYFLSGWIIVFAFPAILKNIELGGLILLIAGGVAYTGGIYFYSKAKIYYMHTVWHFFVLLGAILHYFSVLYYVFI
ncbi:MAG: hemolysin III family protein [Clostridia bacterium]|nr:hemolysin III family protein [Clostridia bacterium]